MNKKISELYDQMSITYEEKYVTGGWEKNSYMYDEKMANEWFIKSKLSGKIISLGCGSGQDIEICNYPKPSEFIGFDFSNGMLSNARKKFPEYTFINHDCNNMTNSSGDVLVCMFGAGNYIGLNKLLDHYVNINARGAFFILYDENYTDGIVSDYYSYKKSEIYNYLKKFNPVIEKLWDSGNYYVVYWNEL